MPWRAAGLVVVAAAVIPYAANLLAAPLAEGRHAMVVSRHPEASRVGAEVLRDGGNAIDAAVAVSMALAVVLPQAGNIGGGGFLLFRRASDGFTTCIDFRETAPAAAHRDSYRGADGALDTLRVRMGHQSVGVPGTVAGLHLAWSRYGHKPWATLIEPAIALAERGFAANEELADAVESERDKLARFPGAAALLLPRGRPVGAGRRIVQPELASTLRTIAASGPQAFYAGPIAEQIAREMEQGGGWITRDDLARYQAIEREPLRGRYRDLEVVCAPPPSSGGVTLLQILGMLDGFDLRHLPPHAGIPVHLLVEAMSRAFADRNTYLGDPDFVRVPVRELLLPEYLARRRSTISTDRATPARFVKPGDVSEFESRWAAPTAGPAAVVSGPSGGLSPRDSLPAHSDSSAARPDSGAAPPDTAAAQPDSSAAGADSGAAPPDTTAARSDSSAAQSDSSSAPPDSVGHEPHETTHFSIVDADGNVVSMSTTLNSNFGSGVVVGGGGFFLNNEMDDFDAQPGAPNQFGLVGGEANAIAPGKRMLSSMAPLIVLRDGRPWLVMGARGGPRIITTLVEILLDVYDFGMDLPQAVAAKRIHHQWVPDVVWFEPGALSGEAEERLRRMGHELREQGPRRSSAQCIEITPQGLRRGVSDPRTQGGAAGY